ncbi:MAG: YHYH protein [Actinomycetales bacterium]|nr:YHYH protein [Actinomycetales bacterium]
MDDGIGRRGFLIGGLAAALTVTARGTTGLAMAAEPGKRGPQALVVPVMGNYRISNPATGCEVRVRVSGGIRSMTSNGLPRAKPGTFPNAECPNAIRAQSYAARLPASPERTTYAAYALPQPFGLAVDGVPFDPLAAEFWNRDQQSGWQYDAQGGGVRLGLDRNHAHVQPNGAYHYHGIPDGLLESISPRLHSPLVGWAGDGFPIYATYGYADAMNSRSPITALTSSYRLKSGTRPSGPGGSYDGWFNQDYEYVAGSGDLDQANGRFGVTPEYPKGTYFYVLTEAFPGIPRMFAGEIAASFVKPPGAGLGGSAGGTPPSPSGGPPPGPGGGPPNGQRRSPASSRDSR